MNLRPGSEDRFKDLQWEKYHPSNRLLLHWNHHHSNSLGDTNTNAGKPTCRQVLPTPALGARGLEPGRSRIQRPSHIVYTPRREHHHAGVQYMAINGNRWNDEADLAAGLAARNSSLLRYPGQPLLEGPVHEALLPLDRSLEVLGRKRPMNSKKQACVKQKKRERTRRSTAATKRVSLILRSGPLGSLKAHPRLQKCHHLHHLGHRRTKVSPLERLHREGAREQQR